MGVTENEIILFEPAAISDDLLPSNKVVFTVLKRGVHMNASSCYIHNLISGNFLKTLSSTGEEVS